MNKIARVIIIFIYLASFCFMGLMAIQIFNEFNRKQSSGNPLRINPPLHCNYKELK